jgi:phenylacetic acid degradation operon negative regulatory protein
MTAETRAPTPQAILMTMLGRYCLPDNPALSTQGYIDVLSRIGLSAQTTRLTLSRMTERGLLERHRRGRIAYFRATDVGLTVVHNQDKHTFHGAGTPAGRSDEWTILSFTIPESQRKERHMLRRRLAWEGFGPLRDGMWIAPGDRDLTEMYASLREIGIDQRIEAFTAHPKFDDVQSMISRVWELDALSQRYQQFLAQWDVQNPAPAATDDLGRDLLLISTWRQLLRETPRLPAQHLPEHWPAAACQELFRTLHDQYAPIAAKLFADILANHRAQT